MVTQTATAGSVGGELRSYLTYFIELLHKITPTTSVIN
jgi:hypothetical protein